MKDFFNKPTQVKFWDGEEKQYVGGIAYQDEIICGCCGSIFEILDIYDNAQDDGMTAIIEYDYWGNISDEIIGDDYP